jgi:hypothetical protein
LAATVFHRQLERVCATWHLQYVKLGTEEEGLGLDEIALVREVLPAEVAVVVKIGGPCARADLRAARELGAAGVVAPMVESPFGLRRFLEACAVELGDAVPTRGINVETAQAVQHLPAMLAMARDGLTFVNVGRSDLAASLGWQVADASMHDVVCDVARQVRAAGLPVHVGGQVSRSTLQPVAERVHLDGFHTRFLAFGLPELSALPAVLRDGLELELALLELLAERFPARAAVHLNRASVTASRIEP